MSSCTTWSNQLARIKWNGIHEIHLRGQQKVIRLVPPCKEELRNERMKIKTSLQWFYCSRWPPRLLWIGYRSLCVIRANIPPNVLIILDSSASMDEVTSGQIYDPTIDYSAYDPTTVYPRYAAYILNKKTWNKWVDDYRTITCADLRDNYLALLEWPPIIPTSLWISKKDFQTGTLWIMCS